MSRINPTSRHSGFTLIEITIVMALSGLIILLVFFAFPAGQRAARNTKRKAYLEQVAASVDKFKESQANTFAYPTQANFAANFDPAFPPPGPYVITDNDIDPSLQIVYLFSASASPPPPPILGNIYYSAGYNCSGNASAGLYSLTIGLEGGSFCLDNS